MSCEIILTTAYFPPIPYFAAIAKADKVFVEAHENYVRQSYRNRCEILTCNGPLTLSIPIKHTSGIKEKISEVRIDNSSNWQRMHYNAIISAYGKSPYFCYYADIILLPIQQKCNRLFDLNNLITNSLLKAIGINNMTLQNSHEFNRVMNDDLLDLREFLQPKLRSKLSSAEKGYMQTFSDRFPFVANLSILDLLFNLGPESISYLINYSK